MKIKDFIFFILLIIIPLNLFSKIIMLENFDFLEKNNAGGWTSPFSSGKSYCRLDYVSDTRGYKGYNCKVTFYKGNSGFSGFWVQIIDFKQNENKWKPINLNKKGIRYLSFKVKGLKGGEDFLIRVADTSWVKREDSVPIGKVSRFLKHSITTEWEEVLIPVSEFERIDVTKFAEIVFESVLPEKVEVFIDDVCFKSRKNEKVKLKRRLNKSMKEEKIKSDIAMWAWYSEDYLNRKSRKKLINFCKKNNINIIFAQINMKWKNNNRIAIIEEKDKWREFIRDAHKNGIKVHLLDGYKEFAKLKNHIKMLSQVKAVIDYNKSVKEDERFDGIHHDNEVYLTDEWKEGYEAQKRLLSQELLLIKKIKLLLKRYHSSMEYGIDIPFWYDEGKTPDGTGFYVNFDNKKLPVIEHFIRLCDNVGIMDYRNMATGPDGIIAHGSGEVMTATKLKKKSIFIGVETLNIEPAKITFYNHTKKDLWKELKLVYEKFKDNKGFRGFAIHCYRCYQLLN